MKSDVPNRLPDFLVVGPPRTATTWLYRVLEGHVGLPAGVKETQFFVWNYGLGIDWYRSFFRRCSPDLPITEIAPTYFDRPEARERIKAHIPGCKIICTLRDPVERVYSQYRMWASLGLVDRPFDYASQRNQLGAAASYASNIRSWIDSFGRERVLVLFHEDLEADPQRFLNAACAFAGLEPIDLSRARHGRRRVLAAERMARNPRLARRALRLKDWAIRQRFGRLANLFEDNNALYDFCFGRGAQFPPLDPATRAGLRALLRPEIEELEALVGRDLSAWKRESTAVCIPGGRSTRSHGSPM